MLVIRICQTNQKLLVDILTPRRANGTAGAVSMRDSKNKFRLFDDSRHFEIANGQGTGRITDSQDATACQVVVPTFRAMQR